MASFPAPDKEMLITHVVVSADVERSRRFYVDVLGGEAVLAGPEFSIVALGGSWVTITLSAGPTEDKPGVTLEPPADPSRVSAFMNLRVANIREACATWSAKGARFLTPPLDRGQEIRCYLRDPDDHLLEVGQLVGGASL